MDVAHTLIHRSRFWKILWIDATNDETINFSFQAIAGYPEASASGVKDMKSVIHWLSEMDSNWLLIFDNADGKPSMVSKYLPPGDRGNVLITSRNPEMKRNVSPRAWIKVEEMEEEEAILLLLKAAAFGDETSEELIQASKPIVTVLCFLPLAVDQAGAAIACGLCDIDNYLEMYSECCQNLLAHPLFEGASNYVRAVYTTWEMSFLALEAKVAKGKSEVDAKAAESAIAILQTFAFFHFDGISEDIFRRAAEAAEDDGECVTPNLPYQLLVCNKSGKWDWLFFREGVRILTSYSLINKSGSGVGVYSMHPLVHCWSRDRMLQPEQQTRWMSAKTLL